MTRAWGTLLCLEAESAEYCSVLPVNFLYPSAPEEIVGFTEVPATEESVFGRTWGRMDGSQNQVSAAID